MPIRNGKPILLSPKGVVDAVDGTNTFKGAMSALVNLIPSTSTDNLFVPRPASIEITNFAGFNTPGFISCIAIFSGVAYGLVATADTAGKDYPFAYDIETDTFISISGPSGSNVPTSPATTGSWTPPQIDIIGTNIIITSEGYSGTGTDFFGVIDISTPASPAYDSNNTTTHALPSVPTGVKNFNNRAFFICGNVLYMTDILDALTITNANQTLTLGDSNPVLVMQGLPLNTTSGGIVQSLIAFKGEVSQNSAGMFQIMGDYAGSGATALSLSALPVGFGTKCPLAVCNTPKGIAFISPHGLRLVDLVANVSDPIGDHGTGIAVPFINASVPSRICMAYNDDVLRATVDSVEYWYDFTRQIWTGPHTFPASLIVPYNNTFIVSGKGINAKLWESNSDSSTNDTYVENGTQLQFQYKTVMLPSTGAMAMNSIIETSIGIAFQSNAGAASITFEDENGSIIGQTTIAPNPGSPTIWNSFIWGQSVWLGEIFGLKQTRIPWQAPVVFDQGFVNIVGNCVTGLIMGNLFLRYEPLNYLTEG